VRGNLNYKVEDEDGYVKMNPAEPTFDEQQDEDLYVDMARYKNGKTFVRNYSNALSESSSNLGSSHQVAC